MRPELTQWHRGMNRSAITHHMQVRFFKIHYALASRILNPRVADVPFVWNGPIEYLCSARHLMDFEWNRRLQLRKRLPYTIAGNTAANRIQRGQSGMHCEADSFLVDFIHTSKSGYSRSRSFRMGFDNGQEIPNAGSFQRAPRSYCGS